MGEGELGLMLRRLRGIAGLTQEELAERAGVSVRAISDIERGQRSGVYAATARRLADALELDPRTRSRFEAAARGRRVSDEGSSADKGAVPIPPTRIIGREAELSALAARCGDGAARLLTLIGVGGVGKTRLAIEVARAVAVEFASRVIFVQLGETRDAAVVLSLVARALGIPALEPVVAHIAGHIRSDRTLLVLDTFEHVLEAAAEVAGLLDACPRLVVLATSREPLRLRGEVVFRVEPLGAPAGRPRDLAELQASAAAELFLERVRAARAGLAFSPEDPGVVAEICHRLEGLPLALELAAARVRLLPLSALRDQLEQRLPLLTGGPRDGPPRQRTMRETIAWSYALLDESEQELLRRLSVFSGFTLEGLDAVATNPNDVLDLLGRLADHGLVMPDRDPADPPRFRMFDVVREFALEQLRECGDAEEVAERHAGYFRDLAERAEPQLRRSAQDRWHRRLDDELTNLRLARGWFAACHDAESALRLASAMWMFWPWNGGFAEGRAWLQAALDLAPDRHPQETAKALWGAGWLAFHQGDYAHTGALGRRLVSVATADSPVHQRNGLTLLGMSAMAEHRHDEAVAAFERCVQLCSEQQQDLAWLTATSVLNLGMSLSHAGRPDRADHLLADAAHRYSALGDLGYRARAIRQRAAGALLNGDLARAETLLLDGCSPELVGDDRLGTVEALETLAVVRAARSDVSGAATLSASAAALRTRLGSQPYPFDTAIADRYLPTARAQDPVAWTEGWSTGAALSTDAVLGLLNDAQPAKPRKIAVSAGQSDQPKQIDA